MPPLRPRENIPPRASNTRRLRGFFNATLLTASTLALSASDESLDSLKRLSLDELMNIRVTSVSRYPEPLSESASAVQVITSDQIRRSGASSIPEALRLAHNLNVAQKNAHDWGISARGFNTELSNKLLVLVDGRTVYTPLYSGVFWDVQDYLLDDLDRIEVISGPGGTLWGANAVNGVINITSKTARETQGLHLEGSAGSTLRAAAAVRYGGTLAPGIHYRVYGKHSERGSEQFASGADAFDDWRKSQAGFRIDAEPSSDDTFTFQGDIYDGTSGSVSGGEAFTSGGNLLGRWSRVFANGSDMRLQVYFDRTHLELPIPADANGLAPAGVLTDDLHTYDVDFQHRWQFHDRHTLVWGAGYRLTHDRVINAPSLGVVSPDQDNTLLSAFAQEEFQLRDDLVLTLGTKIEHNDFTGAEIEPNARVQWKFARSRTLWAAVSRAVRTPSRVDRDLLQPAGPLNILRGNPDFDSENVVAYELGYRTALGRHTTLSLASFYNEYTKLRSLSITPATLIPFYFDNNLEGETYGIELAISSQPLPYWRLHGGYNLLKGDIRVVPGRFDLNNALNETADPEHQFTVRSSLDLPGNVEFDAALRWVDDLIVNQAGTPTTVPAYAELDLRIGWRINEHVEFSLVGRNLLDAYHPEHGVPGPQRVEIGRSAYAKIALRY